MGRLIDCNDVYNAIQITTDNFGAIKRVVESNMLTMLSKIETVEAIPKDQYEARLKADMVVILDKIRAEMILEILSHSGTGEEVIQAYADGLKKGLDILDKYKTGSEAEDGD